MSSSRTDAAAGGGVVLRLRSVARAFDRGEVTALDGVDLGVRRGRLLAITGPSGSGKSTLLNVMGLLDHPDEGSVLLAGNEVSARRRRQAARLRGRHLGFLFQDGLVDPALTSVENVMLGLRFAGVPRARRRPLATEALVSVGLDDRIEAIAATLSGGERQRVALARAIAHEPDLLLCDEPTGNLDEESSEVVFDLLRGRAGAGSAVVVVTHDNEMAARCDNWALLRRGSLSWMA